MPKRIRASAPGPIDQPPTPSRLPVWLQVRSGALHLTLRVQPRASRDGVQGEHGGHLRIRLTAPPVDSQANEALVRFLADLLRCPRHQITIRRGLASRLKTVEIRGVSAAAVVQALTPDAPT